MTDQFLAEIRIFPFNFPPSGWAFCNGQLMLISQNTALYSLLGTTYGGDGKSTFALPNLQDSAPMNQGQGPGLSKHFLGEVSGSESVTLIQTELAKHAHTLNAVPGIADAKGPVGNSLAVSQNGNVFSPGNILPEVMMSPSAITPTGGASEHSNLMPYLTVNFCIALQGNFPKRS